MEEDLVTILYQEKIQEVLERHRDSFFLTSKLETCRRYIRDSIIYCPCARRRSREIVKERIV